MSEMTGFHASDGWFFSRTPDGSVRIQHMTHKSEADGGPFVDQDYTMPENVWASVVCSVSAEGEDFDRWMAARRFHGLKP